MSDAPDREFMALQEALAGRYSLVRELGRGGMGIVYLAHEVRLDRPVALKVLPPAMAADPTLRERFLREARTAAKLSQPNIVPIYSVDEVGDFVFIVMMYVEGQTLGERVRERGPVPPSEAARILREVAWALAYAHGQGVIHRDVKPDNVLLEAGSGRALVTDFGIAHLRDERALTTSGEVVGTAEFMSPEQAAGDPIDERSDLYALGVVGYYMLSGRLPHTGDTVAATLAKQITQVAIPLARVSPEVPGELARALDRCLSKDPDARFAGGEELAGALSRTLEIRRELPAPVRTFVERNQKSFPALATITVGAAYLAIYPIVAGIPGGEWGWGDATATIFMTIATLVLAASPLFILGSSARKLLASGYDYDDLLREMKSDLELRRSELAGQHGPRSWVDRWARRLTYGGAGLWLGWLGSILVLPEPVVQALALAVVLPGSLALWGAGLVGGLRHKLRTAVGGDGWFKFWKSRPGRWIFEAAGLGLDRLEAGDAPYRPTELAIGMAADRLYEALPADLKASFPELPEVVRRLEADAERMRARVTELDEMLSSVEGEGERLDSRPATERAEIDARRASLVEDLNESRNAARERVADIVAALETIRLELLRMHAGAGSPASLTADLGSARELSDEIAFLVEGRRQVDEILGVETTEDPADTPIPTPV